MGITDVSTNIQRNTVKKSFRESGVFYALLFMAGIVILFLRSTYAFSGEVIYTEDGTWLGQIYRDGFFYAVFHAKNSYMVLGNLIMLEISNGLNWLLYGDNLANLPMFIALTHYLFYSSCALLPVAAFKKQLVLPARLFLWITIILLPIGYYDGTAFEIFGKISNTGYLFFLIAFCLLIWRKENKIDAKEWKLILCDAVIFVSCATNPTCIVEVAAFFIVDAVEILRCGTFKFTFQSIKNTLSKRYMIHWIILALLMLIPIIYINSISLAVRATRWTLAK